MVLKRLYDYLKKVSKTNDKLCKHQDDLIFITTAVNNVYIECQYRVLRYISKDNFLKGQTYHY